MHNPTAGTKGHDKGSIVDALQLADLALRQVRELPYGRQRLVEIAIALAQRPKVLLLDEPAAGVPSSESHLILDVDASDTGLLEVLDGADNIEFIAVSSVRISDHRHIDRSDHPNGVGDHLRGCEQAEIGKTARGSGACSGHIHRGKTGLFGEFCRQAVTRDHARPWHLVPPPHANSPSQ